MRQIDIQAVKIASITSIVKRPSPDKSQPKRVLLPGRAALLSSVSRGRLSVCLGFFILHCLSPKNIRDSQTLRLAFRIYSFLYFAKGQSCKKATLEETLILFTSLSVTQVLPERECVCLSETEVSSVVKKIIITVSVLALFVVVALN